MGVWQYIRRGRDPTTVGEPPPPPPPTPTHHHQQANGSLTGWLRRGEQRAESLHPQGQPAQDPWPACAVAPSGPATNVSAPPPPPHPPRTAAILWEDGGAVAGLGLAGGATLLTYLTGHAYWDALGSISVRGAAGTGSRDRF